MIHHQHKHKHKQPKHQPHMHQQPRVWWARSGSCHTKAPSATYRRQQGRLPGKLPLLAAPAVGGSTWRSSSSSSTKEKTTTAAAAGRSVSTATLRTAPPTTTDTITAALRPCRSLSRRRPCAWLASSCGCGSGCCMLQVCTAGLVVGRWWGRGEGWGRKSKAKWQPNHNMQPEQSSHQHKHKRNHRHQRRPAQSQGHRVAAPVAPAPLHPAPLGQAARRVQGRGAVGGAGSDQVGVHRAAGGGAGGSEGLPAGRLRVGGVWVC